jgi:hypothetical protein
VASCGIWRGNYVLDYASELVTWYGTLDRPSAFLFALPFLVAAVGLIAHFVRQGLGRD